MTARCDSFVVKTDVHFPTDINLLFDAMRKAIELTGQFCERRKFSDWRQYRYNIRCIKKSYRHAQNSKKNNAKMAGRIKVKDAHQEYINLSSDYLIRIKMTLENCKKIADLSTIELLLLLEVEKFITHAERQISQIKRRVINDEVIPHDEKVFSLFEPHTEWISKGKLGVPVELGVKVCIIEDQYQFILHHKIMIKQTDDKIAVSMAKETKERFAELYSVSYDRGFFTKENRVNLQDILKAVALPKKGRLSEQDKTIELNVEYIKAKQKHSAVESAINALDVHGLDKCLDQGITAFERYVALAVVARNIQLAGTLLQNKEQRLLVLRERRSRKKAA